MILFLRPFNHISLSLIFTFAHMTDNSIAQKVVEHMMQNDRFSQWLGIECLVMQAGKSVIRLKVRDEMVNGFGIAHGGIAFSLADSALAFASNAYGRLSVALECSVSYPAPVHVGDELTATAEELSMTNRIGVYHITVTNQKMKRLLFSDNRLQNK